MHVGPAFPRVSEQTLMKDAILEITSKRLGVTAVCNEEGHLVGVITDGDLASLGEIQRSSESGGTRGDDEASKMD